MRSLAYLVLTEAKNSLKELLHKPAKLVLYLFLFGLVAFFLVVSLLGGQTGTAGLPLYWLKGIYFAFVALFLVMAVQKGLTSGGSIFEMSDVNLLFVSPLNPRSILLYGLLRLAKVSFWSGFFILFQGSTLSNFGVGFGGLLVLFVVFMVCAMVQTLLSLVIYSKTNGSPRRKTLVKVLTAAVFVPFAVVFGLQLLAGGGPLAAAQRAMGSVWLSVVPVAGWASAGAISLLQGNLGAGLLWLGLLVLAGVLLLAVLLFSKAEYYEDVLVATETAFEKKRAAAEGDLQAASATTAKVKVTKTGVGGKGASAIFYKHLRETFRQNRFGFFGLSTIITFACILAASLFLKEFMSTVVLLQVLMWIQIFLIGNGRGLKELYSHFIYLIPEPPFKKVLWSNLELVFKTLLESLLYFVVPGILIGENLLVVVGVVLAYTMFSLFLLGINYLSMRWTEANISQGLLVTLYFLVVVVALLPGLVPALIVAFAVGGLWGTLLALLILSGWELAFALICFALSKDVLHNCDMPSMKAPGR
ncbi:MAG: putative ABC exporter domain-containing protein [Oscillospiraceae bacterium]